MLFVYTEPMLWCHLSEMGLVTTFCTVPLSFFQLLHIPHVRLSLLPRCHCEAWEMVALRRHSSR